MWGLASSCVAGNIGLKDTSKKLTQAASECSDDEVYSNISREEGLECPICCESFNIVENVPYVLWCGHTLCKNCILGLQWAVVKFPTLPVQLPLFISCPWCNMLSFRLVYKGKITFPRKNYFLLWMVESMNGDRVKSHSNCCEDCHPVWSPDNNPVAGNHSAQSTMRQRQNVHHPEPSRVNHNQVHFISYLSVDGVRSSIQKSLVFFMHMIAKLPLVVFFLIIFLYAIPASAAMLTLYVLVTILFAVPSFLILYLSYPTLDWLVREIIS